MTILPIRRDNLSAVERLAKLLAKFMFVALLGSCQEIPEGEKRTTQGGGPGSDTGSCLRIVNGTATSEYPSVGLIISRVEGADEMGVCTGTFVSSNTMITAAHCVKSDSLKTMMYIPRDRFDLRLSQKKMNEIFATGVKPVAYVDGDNGTDSDGAKKLSEVDNDVAVVIFPEGTAPAVASIAKSPPPAAASVTIVGFGRTSLTDAGDQSAIQKRVGQNSLLKDDALARVYPDLLFITGEPTTIATATGGTSIAAKGDSGGPMFYNDQLVGIISVGTVSEKVFSADAKGSGINAYLHMGGKHVQTVFDKARALGAVIPQSQDSAPVSVATPKASGATGSADLSASVNCE